MRRSIFILVIMLLAGISFGQSLKKYAIGASGCSAYFLCNPGTFELTKSEDSSDVYTGECSDAVQQYGIICVKLKEKTEDLAAAEELLVSYLDFLKGQVKISSAAGYGKGHRLKNREDTRGIIDYWQDGDKNNWKVKAWTNGAYVVVMYANSQNELNESKANLYFDSLLFPGM